MYQSKTDTGGEAVSCPRPVGCPQLVGQLHAHAGGQMRRATNRYVNAHLVTVKSAGVCEQQLYPCGSFSCCTAAPVQHSTMPCHTVQYRCRDICHDVPTHERATASCAIFSLGLGITLAQTHTCMLLPIDDTGACCVFVARMGVLCSLLRRPGACEPRYGEHTLKGPMDPIHYRYSRPRPIRDP
jgi:hypothetical protein